MKIPKKYEERYESLETQEGLVDNCKYMLNFSENWSWEGYKTIPVKSKKEALKFIKEATKD